MPEVRLYMQNPALTFHQHLVQLPEPDCSSPAGSCILFFFFLLLRLPISVVTFFNCEHCWLNCKAAVQRLGKQHLGNSWLLAWWGLQSNKYAHEAMFSNYRAGNWVSGRDSALKSCRPDNRDLQIRTTVTLCPPCLSRRDSLPTTCFGWTNCAVSSRVSKPGTQ